MSNFSAWWAFCQLPNHDGLANDGDNPPTRWGFTYPTWVAARRYVGFKDASMQTFLDAAQAEMGTLARSYFWNRQGGQEMPSGPDVVTMDWMWTSGGAVFDIQWQLGFQGDDIDGMIGPKTVERMKAYGTPLTTATMITAWRIAYYDDLGLRADYPGLYTRATDCLTMAKGLIG